MSAQCCNFAPKIEVMTKKISWKKYHKWVGVVMALFLIVFCISGVVLNHRALFSSFDVCRSWLPGSYHVDNYNNGVVKGTVAIGDGRVVAFGYGGVWLTDRHAAHWREMNDGFPEGVDHRSVRNLVMTKQGTLWCATNYDVYRYDGKRWRPCALPLYGERLMDLAISGDSSRVVALSRSALYVISPVPVQKGGAVVETGTVKVERKELPAAHDYQPRDLLFRTIWKLHSGELFGLAGRLVVDVVAVIIVILSVTGIVLFLLPYRIRRKKHAGDREGMKRSGRHFVWNLRWHNRIGRYTVVLTLLLTVTGSCLRPPLMVPFVLLKSAPVNYTDNVWNDRLRALRWDNKENLWLVSTADGFMRVDSAFASSPRMIAPEKAPVVSPMGVNVLRQQKDGTWLVGSFSGMSRWNAQTGVSIDCLTGKRPVKSYGVKPGKMVSGYSEDFGKPVTFDYSLGATTPLKAMPETMQRIPLSLWNFALELHVGRCYAPFLGPLSDLFVFIWGVLCFLVILSGYIIKGKKVKR